MSGLGLMPERRRSVVEGRIGESHQMCVSALSWHQIPSWAERDLGKRGLEPRKATILVHSQHTAAFRLLQDQLSTSLTCAFLRPCKCCCPARGGI